MDNKLFTFVCSLMATIILMTAAFTAGVKITQKIYEEREQKLVDHAIEEIAIRQQELEDEETIIRNLDALPAQLAITSFDGGAPVTYGVVHKTEHCTYRYEHQTTTDRSELVEYIKWANDCTTSARDRWYIAIYDSSGNEV